MYFFNYCLIINKKKLKLTSGGKSVNWFSSKLSVRRFLNKPILVGISVIQLLLNINSDNEDKLNIIKKKKQLVTQLIKNWFSYQSDQW